MLRVLFTAIFLLGVGAAAGQESKSLIIHAQISWGVPAKGQQLVIRNPMELINAFPTAALGAGQGSFEVHVTEQVKKVLRVKDIDWKKQMLVMLAYGEQTIENHEVYFKDLIVKGDTLEIRAEHRLPGAKMKSKGGYFLTQIALVERFDGPVTFKVKSIPLK